MDPPSRGSLLILEQGQVFYPSVTQNTSGKYKRSQKLRFLFFFHSAVTIKYCIVDVHLTGSEGLVVRKPINLIQDIMSANFFVS